MLGHIPPKAWCSMTPFVALFETQDNISGSMVTTVAVTVHSPSFMEAVQTVYEFCRVHSLPHESIVHVVNKEIARG